MTRSKSFSYPLFLLGLGSQLQIIASLSMTEAFALAAAPVLFFSELPYMRRNGIMPLFWLSFLVVFGCVVACWANHTEIQYVLRGMATVSLLPCSIAVGHWALRKDMNGFKCFIVGVALSEVLCTFVFQRAVEATQAVGGIAGSVGAADIMRGPLFWVSRLGAFLLVPAKGWYLNCPLLYSVGAPLFMAGFSMLTTVSGRSAALGALGSAVLVLIGGKTQRTMKRIGKYFFLLGLLAVGGIFAAKTGYQIAATQGWLGEKARDKYEAQTKGNKSLGALLLGGRMESFCGLIACVDKPIIGFGPWAMDEKGYVREFLMKFANEEDFEQFLQNEQWMAKSSGGWGMHLIPGHAIIVQFWLWYGIFGLLFWLYIIFILLRYLKQDCWAVPQWYFWLTAAIPGTFWNIFFSPFGDRFGSTLFFVAILLVRAVRKGRQMMPLEMCREIMSECKRC